MDNYVEKLKLFAFNFAPREWMPCEGQLLNIE
jgi:microcystin-dependent protein